MNSGYQETMAAIKKLHHAVEYLDGFDADAVAILKRLRFQLSKEVPLSGTGSSVSATQWNDVHIPESWRENMAELTDYANHPEDFR